MGVVQSRRWCKECGRKTLHEKHGFSNGMGCLLTILTGGLFLVVWLVIGVLEAFKPFRCQQCGQGRLT